MALRHILPVLGLFAAFPAVAAPPAPLPPAEATAIEQFFASLPRSVPEDLDNFEGYVSQSVKVYREGKLTYANRDVWFAHLRSFASMDSAGPRDVSISREAFYRTVDGGIAVLEFSYPLAPQGIVYHPQYPLQIVTYHLNGSRLVRVDYGPQMQSLDTVLPGKAAPAGHMLAPKSCPRGPEPSPLDTAAFSFPKDSQTLLFSAAPSFRNERYAVVIVKPHGAAPIWAKFKRYRKRLDCNSLAESDGRLLFLRPGEADPLFEAADQLIRTNDEPEVVLDGTMIEVQRFSSGRKILDYRSNGLAARELSALILAIARRQPNGGDLPDW